MSGNDDNFGGTKLVGENGEQMDPAIAGISPPSISSLEGDVGGATTGAEMDKDNSGQAGMDALKGEDDNGDVTASGAE
ncbi:hypothetical protein [Sphingomonas sp.]|uniref:hypothetical protein n=1 Tax=Sphingomonas sp. TaxID=28214 RepID=UPI003B00A21D